MFVRAAQRLATLLAPAIHAAGASRALDQAITFANVLGGQGSGSGWDHDGEIAAVARLVDSSHPVIFDVGANDGRWSQSLGEKLGGIGSFHLFECAPICLPALERRQAAIPDPHLVRAAVSDRDGTAILHAPILGLHNGLASLHPRSDVSVGKEVYEDIEVPTITLDRYAADQQLTTLDLVKMDIEGHELFALRGAERLLSEHRVRALTFEFGSSNVNSRTFFRDFWDLLTGHGFALLRLLPGGSVRKVPLYAETLEYFRGATNYAAVLES